MFDWLLFICLVGVSMPGILVAIPQTLNTIEKTVITKQPAGKKMPPKPVLIINAVVGSLTIIAVAAAVGTALAYRVNLQAPFFEALVSSGPIWSALQPQIVPALIGGIGGSIVFIAAYYLIFRLRLDYQTVKSMENLRMGLGIWGRILYGGIYEEVLTRWGLMSLFVWILTLLAGDTTAVVVWIAIIISGVLFGLGHLPSHLAAGCQKTPLFFTLAISLNLWAALIFGWLFWQYGLLSAMIAHMLFHIVWFPFDIYFYRGINH